MENVHGVSETANGVGETEVGWGKFWLGQCPSVPNELPDGETNYVFGEQVSSMYVV